MDDIDCAKYSNCQLFCVATNRKTQRFHYLLLASFKNCKPLLEAIMFQRPSLFVCTMDMMNHIIGITVLYACMVF